MEWAGVSCLSGAELVTATAASPPLLCEGVDAGAHTYHVACHAIA